MRSRARLHVRQLGKAFGGLQALDDVELVLQPGQIGGLIGPNGAGKTTLLNLITGLVAPSSGSIQLDGQELVGLRPHQIAARGIGRTFQGIRLFANLSVLDNVRVAQCRQASCGPLGLLLHRPSNEARLARRARALLELVGLWDQRDRLAPALPYGEQRRLELARALALEPSLLLLDEPAAGLNMVEREQLIRDLRRIHGELGVDILLVEHDMRLVMGLSDYVCVLDFGRKIAQGAPADVSGNPAVRAAYLGAAPQAS